MFSTFLLLVAFGGVPWQLSLAIYLLIGVFNGIKGAAYAHTHGNGKLVVFLTFVVYVVAWLPMLAKWIFTAPYPRVKRNIKS